MSIATTICGPERANAVYKAANAVPVAKRGMFAMIEREHRYTSLLHGAYAAYRGYTPAVVTSVTRDGIVKAVRLADGREMLKRDWDVVTVDSARKVTDPVGVLAKLREDTPYRHAIEYRDKTEAIKAIRQAAGF